jgi:hypothetical protein
MRVEIICFFCLKKLSNDLKDLLKLIQSSVNPFRDLHYGESGVLNLFGLYSASFTKYLAEL